jgi:transcriptional regulator with GAF, ATPase, and Fis domain
MQDQHQVLLAVWREACQHIEIQESTTGIAALLAAHLPVDRLEVFRVELEPAWVGCVASAPRTSVASRRSHTEISSADFKRLVQWIERGDFANVGAGTKSEAFVAPFRPTENARDFRIAPLKHGEESLGALVITSRQDRFLPRHDQLLQALVEPFAAALANDRRLHELAALRETAEADRRSLLRRLGRSGLSDQIVGEEGGLAQVMKRVELVCQSDAPVLLLGETGTGKEVVARAIHERSGRGTGPFIRVNCGAIPPELVDSQLFGHEKGAFTGAVEMRRGWFERASAGTLFLDEIGELPPNAQVRFLRVLQDSHIERVGGGDPIHVDVRVVAATNRDLAAMVQRGTFREDLWYRIAVFPILLPPLRDRLDDVPALAAHFAHKAAVRFGFPPVEPTDAHIQMLRAYSWPGNIRELGAVLDRAAILGEGRSLEIQAALGFGTAVPSNFAPAARPATDLPAVAPLDVAMRQHIEQALRVTHGRIEGPTGAAALLAINPHTLRARMRKLHIDWAQFRHGPAGD